MGITGEVGAAAGGGRGGEVAGTCGADPSLTSILSSSIYK